VEGNVTMLDKSAAFLAGAAISTIVKNLKETNSKFFLSALEKTAVLPSFDETTHATNKILDRMHHKDPSIKVLFVENTPDDMKKISDIIAKNTLVGFRKTFNVGDKGLIAKGIKFFADVNASWIAKGKKASYFINEKVAIISKNTHQMIFHEIGHAKVAQKPVLKPLLTIGKKLPLISAISGFFALEHSPRPNNPKRPKKLWEKTQDYLDGNIGRITFLTFMPLLIEKSIATRKGLHHAEKYLDKAKMKSLTKLHRIGLITYFASAFAAAAGIGLGNKVQNNIIKQKQSPQDVVNLLI
jgi:hypothetical protein